MIVDKRQTYLEQTPRHLETRPRRLKMKRRNRNRRDDPAFRAFLHFSKFTQTPLKRFLLRTASK